MRLCISGDAERGSPKKKRYTGNWWNPTEANVVPGSVSSPTWVTQKKVSVLA